MRTVSTTAARDEIALADLEPMGGPGSRPRRAPRATTVGEALAWTVAALLVGAAGIHFAMMGEHAGVSWTHGTFFAVVAWVQVVLAVAVVLRRNRWVPSAIVVTNLAVLGVWVLTRTVGIAIGSDGTPEAWGWTDTICALLEGLAIVGCLGLLSARVARRPVSASVGFGGAAFVGVVVAAIVTLVFSPAWAGGSGSSGGISADGHNHGGSVPVSTDGHSHGVAAPVGHSHATTLNGQPVKGVKAEDVAAESQPDQPLDAATRATLKAQLVQARDFAMRFPTVADATAAGYKVAGGFAPGSGAHYQGGAGGLAGIGPFRPDAPMTLIYAGTNPGSELTGLMYYGIGDVAPEGFAGPNDHWHRHSNVCIKGGVGGAIDVPFPADADVTKAQCSDVGGNLMPVTGWMVHAWVVPTWESPLGVFSHDNPNVRCADGTYKTNASGFCQGV